jgi:2-iminobutanoate/2-iminopropanoate deaminase
MINIDTILKSCGIGFENIVKVNVYLSDLSLFGKFNAVYKTYFGNDFPARTTIGANLLGIMIEIDCIAVK